MMEKRALQVTCCFGEKEVKEILFESFRLYLRRVLEHGRGH